MNSELFHGSPGIVAAILPGRVFGGLFAAASERSAISHGDVLHVIESPRHLSDYELN